jgi:hypothetical protein
MSKIAKFPFKLANCLVIFAFFLLNLHCCGIFAFFPSSINWPPRYNWNIVESGVKYHTRNHFVNGIACCCFLYSKYIQGHSIFFIFIILKVLYLVTAWIAFGRY